ncbi:MAG: amidohydrolase [Bacteroidales bacterium]|nr:amidohydrolase [Bacteroidales bacterium]
MTYNEIVALRHELHRNPEISNLEYKTSERITGFINAFAPDEVIKLGNTGRAFVFRGKAPGKTLMFRAELDALPIQETSSVAYSSAITNVSHACGHDGHMAIVAGLASKIAKNRPEKGTVVLLFQPAEEVEQGARDVVENVEFKRIEPDCIFALHNIPGIEKNKILLKAGTFASASKGMTVKLFGKTSHAAEPENGISPANAVAEIIRELHRVVKNKRLFKDVALLTIIHIRMGEVSFGTTPGYAEIMVTLRAFENEDMAILTREGENIIKGIAKTENLTCEISYSEVFPAVVNHMDCLDLVKQSADKNNLKTEFLNDPFKWSEDFAYYTQKYKGCFFGLGAGVDHPQLHNPDFDFPDEIIETGINMFDTICKNFNF